MTTNLPEIRTDLTPFLDGSKQAASRMRMYLAFAGNPWPPQLGAWVEHLRERGLKDTTVKTYATTIRTAYKSALKDGGELMKSIMRQAPGGPADKRAAWETYRDVLMNQLEQVTTKVETTDEAIGIRLSPDECKLLLASPDTATLAGIRDQAAIAVMLCTGIRMTELRNLKLADLRHTHEGVLSLKVKGGKGNKTRYVPYGGMSWCLVLVDRWLGAAGIDQGKVFRGVNRHGQVNRRGLGERTLAERLTHYPIVRDGHEIQLSPHDLRRTYARTQYDASMGLDEVRANLGHSSIETTMSYIGDPSFGKRQGKAAFYFST